MKFDPKNPPKAGDAQISASFLNDLLRRISRLESLHVKSPISLHESITGLCLSLTESIQTVRLAKASEIHNGGAEESSICHIVQFDPTGNTFAADTTQEIQVFDPFKIGFWPNDLIIVIKYHDYGKWIHMPIGPRYFYGITQAELAPCSDVAVQRVKFDVFGGELEGFYTVYNPHDWDAPSGIFIQAKWEPEAQTFVIFSADCEASCLGL